MQEALDAIFFACAPKVADGGAEKLVWRLYTAPYLTWYFGLGSSLRRWSISLALLPQPSHQCREPGRSCSVMAVNFSPHPWSGTLCITTASARICPSCTKKSTLIEVPTARTVRVFRKNPPRLRSRTLETSSRPLQFQQTQTFCR